MFWKIFAVAALIVVAWLGYGLIEAFSPQQRPWQ